MDRKGVTKAVEITLDKPRHLRVDFNALIEFKHKTGKALSSIQAKDMDEEYMCILVWACLLHEDPELTLKDVGAMLGFGNAAEIVKKIEATIIADAAEVTANSKNQKRPTG